MGDLTFKEFAEANLERMVQWHKGQAEDWSGADWGNAAAGEMGEACNVVKKLRRIETGTPGSQDAGEDELRVALAKELADTVAYLDLLAQHYDIDLGVAVADKFNEVSEREGFPQRVSRGWEPLPDFGNGGFALGRLCEKVIADRDREVYPAGLNAGEVLGEIRRRYGPEVYPQISPIDCADAIKQWLGPGGEL